MQRIAVRTPASFSQVLSLKPAVSITNAAPSQTAHRAAHPVGFECFRMPAVQVDGAHHAMREVLKYITIMPQAGSILFCI